MFPRQYYIFIKALKVFDTLSKTSRDLNSELQQLSLAIEKINQVEDYISKASETMVNMYGRTKKIKSLLTQRENELQVAEKDFDDAKASMLIMQEAFDVGAKELKEKLNFIEVTSTEVTKQCAAASDSIQEITSSSLMKLRTSKNPSPQLLSILDVVLLVLRKEIYSGDNVFSSTEMEQKDDKIRGRSKFNFLQSCQLLFYEKRNFLDLLKSVNRDMINAETAELISPYFVKLTELNMEDTSNVSPLFKWAVCRHPAI